MNTQSDGYTIHHCHSPMTLRHARQPPIHLSAKWLASLWLSAAAIMAIYLSAALPFSSPYFPSCFSPKCSNRAWPGAPASSQTSLPGRFQTSHLPIKQRAFFIAASPHSWTDVRTQALNCLPLETEWPGAGFGKERVQVEKGTNTLFWAWGEHASVLSFFHPPTTHLTHYVQKKYRNVQEHVPSRSFSWPFHGGTQGVQKPLWSP